MPSGNAASARRQADLRRNHGGRRGSPIAVICARSFNDFIRSRQYEWRYRQSKGIRRLEVDKQLELDWLLDGHAGRVATFEDFIDIPGSAVEQVRKIGAIRNSAAGLDTLSMRN